MCNYFIFHSFLTLPSARWAMCWTGWKGCWGRTDTIWRTVGWDYWTALYCTALYCIVLQWTALHWTELHLIWLYWTSLHFTARPCTMLHCTMYLTMHSFSLKLCSATLDLKIYIFSFLHKTHRCERSSYKWIKDRELTILCFGFSNVCPKVPEARWYRLGNILLCFSWWYFWKKLVLSLLHFTICLVLHTFNISHLKNLPGERSLTWRDFGLTLIEI